MAKATKSGGYVRPEGGEESSAGTSSLTSGSKPGLSGDSAPDTEQSLRSPAQGTENLSVTPQPTSVEQRESAGASSAGSAGGSTQETTPSRSNQQDSSAEGTPTSPKRKATGKASPAKGDS